MDLKRLRLVPKLFDQDPNLSVAIGKPERQVRKASHCGSKQQ